MQFEAVRSEAGLNRFVMTPTKWIEQTNAIEIVSKAGRYGGGTYEHSDIAMAFATWISPEFQLYIMKDYILYRTIYYERLSQTETGRKWSPVIGLEFEQSIIKGELSIGIHRIHQKELSNRGRMEWINLETSVLFRET